MNHKLNHIGLLFVFFSVLNCQIFVAQKYETICNIKSCSSCNGTGTATYKKSYRAYDNLTYKDKGGWNQSRDYYYTNSYIKTESVTGTCQVCGGRGRYKHCRQVYIPSKKPRRVIGTSSRNQSFYKAKRDFARIKKDLLGGHLLVQDKNGKKHVIALGRNTSNYRFVERNVYLHYGTLNNYGKYSSHRIKSRTNDGKVKTSFYNKDFKLKYVIKGKYVDLKHNDLFWVESGGFDNYYDYGKALKFLRMKLYNARTKQFLTKRTYLGGFDIKKDEIPLIRAGYYPAYAMVRGIDGKWTKQMGIINANEEVIVPFTNKEIYEYDLQAGLITVINAFDVLDNYSINNGLIEPVGEINLKCPDGSVVRRTKKRVITKSSRTPVERTMKNFTDGKTGKSFPYIFTSCYCYESEKWLNVRLLNMSSYMVDRDDQFAIITNSGYLTNHNKNPIPLTEASPYSPISIKYQGKRIIYNDEGNKTGHKYYKNGAFVFDNIIRLAGGKNLIEQNGKKGLLVKEEISKKMHLFFPDVADFKPRVARTIIPFKNRKGKWGLMDTRFKFIGKEILPPKYDSIRPFLKYVLTYSDGAEQLYKISYETRDSWKKPSIITKLSLETFKDKSQELRIYYTRQFTNIDFGILNSAYGHLRYMLGEEKFTVTRQSKLARVHNYTIKNRGLAVIFADSEKKVVSAIIDGNINHLALLKEDTKRGNYTLLAEYASGYKGLVQITKGNTVPDKIGGKLNGFKVRTYKATTIIDDSHKFKHYYGIAKKPKPSYIFSKSKKFYGVSTDKEKDVFIYHFTPFKIR